MNATHEIPDESLCFTEQLEFRKSYEIRLLAYFVHASLFEFKLVAQKSNQLNELAESQQNQSGTQIVCYVGGLILKLSYLLRTEIEIRFTSLVTTE